MNTSVLCIIKPYIILIRSQLLFEIVTIPNIYKIWYCSKMYNDIANKALYPIPNIIVHRIRNSILMFRDLLQWR